jgi:hypothetical protein
MRLLLDAHMVVGIAIRLREAGIDAIAVAEHDELRTAGDDELLDAAAKESRVLVTRDTATVRTLLHARWASGRSTWGAVFVASSVPSSRRGAALVVREVVRIVAEHPGDGPFEHELWIGSLSG